MTTSDQIAQHIKFDKIKQPNLISYTIIDNANGDSWSQITVILNGSTEGQEIKLPKGEWMIIARDGKMKADGSLGTIKGGKNTVVEPTSALILAQP